MNSEKWADNISPHCWVKWLPSIPLARGVPVIEVVRDSVQTLGRGLACYTMTARPPSILGRRGTPREAYGAGVRFDEDRSTNREMPLEEIRVDLDDDLGFAYAAMTWLRGREKLLGRPEAWRPSEVARRTAIIKQFQFWMQRCAIGEITDGDRLALAQALAEVMA